MVASFKACCIQLVTVMMVRGVDERSVTARGGGKVTLVRRRVSQSCTSMAFEQRRRAEADLGRHGAAFMGFD